MSGAYLGPRNPGEVASSPKNRRGPMLTKLGSSAVGSPSSFDKSEPSVGYCSDGLGTTPVRMR